MTADVRLHIPQHQINNLSILRLWMNQLFTKIKHAAWRKQGFVMKGTAGSVTCGSFTQDGCVIVCHMRVFGCGLSCQGKTTFSVLLISVQVFKCRNTSCVNGPYDNTNIKRLFGLLRGSKLWTQCLIVKSAVSDFRRSFYYNCTHPLTPPTKTHMHSVLNPAHLTHAHIHSQTPPTKWHTHTVSNSAH